MNRSRQVTAKFSARKYAKQPVEYVEFTVGELVVFARSEDGHSIFQRESDPQGADPFVMASETFDAVTEPISTE